MSQDTLEPKLTKYDERALAALDVWTADRDTLDDPLDFRSVWEVGQILAAYDLTELRNVLDGLERFGYVIAQGWGPKRRWIAAPWKRDKAESVMPSQSAAVSHRLSDSKAEEA